MNQPTFREFLRYADTLHARASTAPNQNGAMPYLIGSILTSWIALETFVNNMARDYVALPKGKCSVHEEAFLLEKQVIFNKSGRNAGRFSIGKNPEFKRIDEKMLFLVAKFGSGSAEKGGQLWQKFERAKERRNALIHYRRDSETTLTAEDAKETMETVKETIEFLSKAVWGKAMRW